MDLDTLLDLMDWLEQWESAQAEYFSWVKKEYADRKTDYEAHARDARGALYRAVNVHLHGDGRGRTHSSTPAAIRGKQQFTQRVDEVLSSLVEAGEDVFAIRGSINRAGVFIGNVKPALGNLALSKLKKAFDAAQD